MSLSVDEHEHDDEKLTEKWKERKKKRTEEDRSLKDLRASSKKREEKRISNRRGFVGVSVSAVLYVSECANANTVNMSS